MDMPRTVGEESEDVHARTVNPQNKTRIFYWVAVLFFFVFPFTMVALPGVPAGLGRVVAVSSFVFFFPLFIFWFGLSPKSRMIRAAGKLNEPRFDRVRPQIEKGIRIFIIAFGVFFSYEITLPLASDLSHLLVGEKPIRIAGTITYKSVPFGGLWFLNQSVRLRNSTNSYYLQYSWRSIRVGGAYELFVLPRSRQILEFHESGE